jgi:histidinol-phosphate aminotransferase
MSVRSDAPSRIRIRPELESFAEYRPTPTPAALAMRLGLPLERIVKLDANENPYGAPPGVAAALAGLDTSRYPDADAGALRDALAAYTGRPVESIICGNGSDELLELLCRLFVAPGDTVVTTEPTFGMYAIAARQHGARVLDAARGASDFAVDPAAVLRAAEEGARLIFLCAPNNPTGTALPEADLRAILAGAPCPVVLDEAYAEFAGQTALPLLDAFPHLIILRTLSKFAGLAGLRVGYGLFAPEIARALWKIKAPYNVSVAAQVAGVAALADLPWLEEKAARIRAGRDWLAGALGALPGLHVYPSAANFVLARLPDAGAADRMHDGLQARGILIRRYTRAPLEGCLRFSVGTTAQNTLLMEEVRQIWAME